MIDASIPLKGLLPNYLDDAARLQQIAASRQQMDMQKQKMAEEADERRTMGSLFAGGMPTDPAARQQTIGQIGAHNPQLAFKLQQHFQQMDEASAKREGEKWRAATPVLAQLKNVPAQQRSAYLHAALPALQSAGWTPQEIDGVDLSDQSIDALAHTGYTVEQVLDSNRITWHQRGDQPSFATDSMGNLLNPQAVMQGDNEGAQAGGGQPQTIGGLQSYKSTGYDAIEAPLEQKYGLPHGLMSGIRTRGERSNSDQVSSAGARSVYQITPETRQLFLNKYGVDAYASPESAAQVAALHLRDSIARGEDPVRGYIGGPDKSKWRQQTQAYAGRVNGGQSSSNKSAVLAQANAAIQAGADPAKVKARLQQMGIVQ